ncbi:hypothetical protein DV451_000220 [Geotrichum candidum]|uniref:Uncharacterized protein n=1 Tax=Geotrichum candidum TaxID=1173061 RepID=A0A9P5KXS2_GEOCN|nr:hypothetical protein DV451_000220 [Geotrichum candidum]KAF5106238.1 hypothetical protein DV453_004090 [Geotrichum candidum]
MSKVPFPRRNSDLLNIPKDIESIHQNESPISRHASISSTSSGNNTEFHDYAYNRGLSESRKSVDANSFEAPKSPTAPAIETLDDISASPRHSIASSEDIDRSLSKTPEKHSERSWNLKDQCFNYEQYKQQIYNKVLFGRDRFRKTWHDYRFGASDSGDSGNSAESHNNGTGNQHHHRHEHRRHSRQNSIEDPAITASGPATSASSPSPTTSTDSPRT